MFEGVRRRTSSRERENPPLAKLVGVIAIVLGLVAIGAAWGWDWKSKSETGAVASSVVRATTPPRIPDSRLRVSIIGDGISSGTLRNSTVWPKVLGEEYDWSLNNTAGGGGGYVKGANVGRDLNGTVARAYATNPDVVIVAGGTNDVAQDPEAVRRAAVSVLARMRSMSPDVLIIVLGPISTTPVPSPAMLTANNSVGAAARELGMQYIDTMSANPLGGLNSTDDTGLPTDDGQRRIADLVDSALPASMRATR